MDRMSQIEQLQRRLYFALVLNASIIVGEFSGGLLIHSVGLVSDAWHNLIDQGSLFLTLYAHILAARPATGRRTFGYHRVGVLTALINAVILLGVALGLSILAVRRLRSPVSVPGGWVMVIALFSFAANLSIALLLQRAAKSDINIRSDRFHHRRAAADFLHHQLRHRSNPQSDIIRSDLCRVPLVIWTGFYVMSKRLRLDLGCGQAVDIMPSRIDTINF
jgi:Co/Zn/Cd efflux system component